MRVHIASGGAKRMTCEGPVHLRRATADDAAGIAAVHNEAWLDAHRDLLPSEALHCMSDTLRERFWRAELLVESHDRAPWLAMIDERIIGFAVGGLTRDDDADSGTGEIYQLFVDPECWSQGVRTSLVDHVIRDLEGRGFERITFWVLTGDIDMRALMVYLRWQNDEVTRYEICSGVELEQMRFSHTLG